MEEKNYNSNNRINSIDFLRGISIIFVVFYHLIFDLVELYDKKIFFWGTDYFEFIHYLFLLVLFIVSGISTSFSKNIFKRAATVILSAYTITFITVISMPEQIILFGVLHYLGYSMMIYGFFEKISKKIKWYIKFIFYIFLYIVFFNIYTESSLNFIFTKIKIPSILLESDFLYPFGIVNENFTSSDYFPILPWIFVFLIGTAISDPILNKKLPEKFYNFKSSFITFIGKHTLVIYLIHQPIIIFLLYIYSRYTF